MTRTLIGAELVDDCGAAAADNEFFRSPPFLSAEKVTHSLVVGGGRVVVPVVLREIPGGGCDAVSPYGYPGGTVHGAPIAAEEIDFTGTGLVSLFVRDRLGTPSLGGGVRRGAVMLHDPALPRFVQSRVAAKVRSNERLGYTVESIRGREVDESLTRAFGAAYIETMTRAGAEARYFFCIDYLDACLSSSSAWLTVVRGPDGELAAGAIAVRSDGVLHYYLGGSSDVHSRRSPAKNTMVGMQDLADSLGIRLNLGGGIVEGDSLHTFKTGFANSVDHFITHDIVCRPEEYARLAVGRRPTGYFPAYRDPGAG